MGAPGPDFGTWEIAYLSCHDTNVRHKFRAGGAVVISPALQRGVGKTNNYPESRRDGAQTPRPFNVFSRRKHKPGTTPVNVKLLLPPRQSRGFSFLQ